ncbi:hypothetical protein [Burkholderia multivorans]|uniref:hypothetical protein n=1 Tax=Burkholderia multivorans TaxID=87883 RepID=UPI0019CFC319|nr:hypothetical protein [Burkholderia multivorans]MBN6729305.1 hypothetical protein [Burkholderia multivorans]MBN6737138.1 hypothetical protein [Burkholderia multivorans]MBN7125792.1 hypothetical protein [Burkholderia multivorans]MBN8167644.1 hypothetical protein [Burkholderia multivorans]QSL25409.1 hypothetical protein G0D92_09500 [Burkholderia multivorans]
MSYEYSAQNHDWDLTLYAAAELIKAGIEMDKRPKTGNMSMGFSFFTGGMVLSFAAIESFSASVAFCMASDNRFAGFDFQRYRTARRFWDKMELLMSAAGIEVDKGSGLFQHIGQMQEWRNLVTHASPYEVEPTEIPDTVQAPHKLHQKKKHLDYARMAEPDHAKKFYETAVAYIELVKQRTDLDPRAFASYKALE